MIEIEPDFARSSFLTRNCNLYAVSLSESVETGVQSTSLRLSSCTYFRSRFQGGAAGAEPCGRVDSSVSKASYLSASASSSSNSILWSWESPVAVAADGFRPA